MNPNANKPAKRPLACLPALVVVLLALFATPALAARGHVFCEKCSFTPEGAHAFNGPSGVAVSEATGDVYVVDKGNDRVEYFTAKGEYQGEFNGSGTLLNECNKVTSECLAAGSGKYSTEEPPAGVSKEIPTGRFEEPEGIAVDNSCSIQKLTTSECEAQDPSAGDVYVVDAGSAHCVVDKYSPVGEYLGQITEGQTEPEGPVEKLQGRSIDGLTVDPHGTMDLLWEKETRVEMYNDHTPNAFTAAFAAPFALLGFPERGPGSFAADGGEAFYGLGRQRVTKFNSAGSRLIQEVDAERSSAVAVNLSDSQSFVDNLTTVRVSEPDGTEAERLGEEAGAKHLVQGAGIGVNAGAGSSEGAGSVYVADAGTGQVVVFGLTEPAAPSITGESVSGISADSADLGAEVNPRSEPGEAATEYHFEYGPCASASSCAESRYGSETRTGTLAAGFEAQGVSAHVGGLLAGTTYHFRALARNSHNQLGEYEPGLERVFTTQNAGGPLVLPDGRGWELVSPPDKQGALIEPIAEFGVVQAAADGDGITYTTNSPTETQPAGYANLMQVLSRRGAAAWGSLDIGIPHSAAAGNPVGPGPEYKFFNPDLTLSAVQPAGQFNPALSAEASESTAYLHDLTKPADVCTPASDCYVPLVTEVNDTADPFQPFGQAEECIGSGGVKQTCGPLFQGATEDLTHVVLSSQAALTPGAGARQLYEWSGGTLSHVSVLPKGEAAPEDARLGLKNQATRGAISADGSRIAWESVAALYQRDMPRGETAQLDQAEGKCEAAGECKSGGGRFQFASADGSRVFFSDTHRLSEDSGANAAGEPKADLYECQMSIEAGKLHCALHDLTPKRGAEGAEVQGSVLGASEDGEYVYFVAKGVPSETPNSAGQSALAEQPNLYLRHGGATSFIVTLARGDGHDWEETLLRQPTRVSPDGRFLELMSEASLTGYDNRDVATGNATAEVYLYDATANSLVCASCDPTGARPVGVEYLKLEPGSGGLVGGGRGTWEKSALVAANVPGWTAVGSGESGLKERYQPRYLANSGRLFFNTINALVPQDSNGTQDVYEYDPLGLESREGKSVCEASSPEYSATSGGCVALISSGSSAKESAFMDASETGDDVFFLTAARLSPLDVDASLDIYDAHVCTTASPCITFPNVQSPPCTTEASCKAAPTPQPSVFGAPASATFQGLGNPAPPATAAVKTKAKPPTRAQKLHKALKACKKDRPKAKRAQCQRLARNKFGPVKKSKKR